MKLAAFKMIVGLEFLEQVSYSSLSNLRNEEKLTNKRLSL